jgi:hypothetical protein
VAWCDLLTEIRAFGEGIIISDQSPQKLARDAIRNTNLQLAHQLRDAADRQAIADAMLMDNEQQNYLGKLERGFAALFHTGLEKATFVRVEPYDATPTARGAGFRLHVPDAELREYMLSRALFDPRQQRLEHPYAGCALCQQQCRFLAQVYPLTTSAAARAAGSQWFRHIAPWQRDGLTVNDLWNQAAAQALVALLAAAVPLSGDALWCHFVHTWHFAVFDGDGSEQEAVLTAMHRQRLLESLSWIRQAASPTATAP